MEGRGGWLEPAVGGGVKLCKGEEEHDLVKRNPCSRRRMLLRNRRLER